MSNDEKAHIIKRYNELIAIPYQLMTIEQVVEFDNLIDLMKEIQRKGK